MILLANLAFVLVLFPFLTPVRTSYDTQPWALIFAVIVLTALFLNGEHKRLFSLPLVLLFGFIVFAVAIYFLRSDDWFGLRSLATYVSVPVFAAVAIGTFRRINGKVLISAVSIWTVIALLQLFFSPQIAEHIVPRYSNLLIRGVSSLAAEPSALATMAMMFSVLNEFFRSRGSYGERTYVALLVMVIFLAVSSGTGTGLLLAGLLLISRIVMLVAIDQKTRSLVLTVALGALAVALVSALPKLTGYANEVTTTDETRVDIGLAIPANSDLSTSGSPRVTRGRDLAVKFLNDPWDTMVTDGSVGERIGHPVIAVRGLFASNGLGYGLGTWNDHAEELVAESPLWIQKLFEKKFDLGGRIHSGWGTPLFELGVFGFAWVLLILWLLARPLFARSSARSAALFGFVLTVPVLTMAVPLAVPAIGYIVGLHILAKRQSEATTNSNLVQFEIAEVSAKASGDERRAA